MAPHAQEKGTDIPAESVSRNGEGMDDNSGAVTITPAAKSLIEIHSPFVEYTASEILSK
jgi:hypothetical protein